ncbi:MAG: 5-formyltetrahydrofolate cyclo-ligase [Betaproteobacteria bacterium]
MSEPASRSDAGAPQGVALREAKLALRRVILARRDAQPAEVHAASSRSIVARIAALPRFASAKAVLLTLPFRAEWDTRPLVRAALAAGKTVVVPRVDAQSRMLDLHSIGDPERDVVAGLQGIPEPLPDRPRIPRDAIDFVVVPGVAFDYKGRRLGYGGGYYDRLLPLLSPRAARVAGAFELQLVDLVPAAPHDIAVDAIVTELRTLVIRQ